MRRSSISSDCSARTRVATHASVRIAVHFDAYSSERLLHARVRLGRARGPRRREGRRHRAPRPVVPHARELRLGARAHGRRPLRRREAQSDAAPAAAARRRTAAAPMASAAASPPDRAAAPRAAHPSTASGPRASAPGPARGSAAAFAACARSAGAGRTRPSVDARPVVVVARLEGRLAVECLVERRAVAELIAPRVDRAPAGAARAPCSGASPRRARCA